MVYSIAWHYLHDRGLAEEVAQDVFLELHRSIGSIESPRHAVFWLRKVAVHRSIDASRRRKRQADVPLENAPQLVSRERAGDPLASALLRRLVASLPPVARMVVVLRYQEEMEPADIAETLGMPLGTVKSSLHRALLVLREKMDRSRKVKG